MKNDQHPKVLVPVCEEICAWMAFRHVGQVAPG